MKKNLFGIYLVFTIVLGVLFSFVPEAANADTILKEGGNESPCWGGGSGWFGSWTRCLDCTIQDGSGQGNQSTCTVG